MTEPNQDAEKVHEDGPEDDKLPTTKQAAKDDDDGRSPTETSAEVAELLGLEQEQEEAGDKQAR